MSGATLRSSWRRGDGREKALQSTGVRILNKKGTRKKKKTVANAPTRSTIWIRKTLIGDEKVERGMVKADECVNITRKWERGASERVYPLGKFGLTKKLSKTGLNEDRGKHKRRRKRRWGLVVSFSSQPGGPK